MSSIFEKIYHDYLEEIRKIDLHNLAQKINAKWNGKELILPLFSRLFFISKNGIKDQFGKIPSHSEIVVLSRYIIGYPSKQISSNKWKHYRDFKDSGPLLDTFKNNVENKIASHFSGNKKALFDCCKAVGGFPYSGEWNYDVSFLFHALPHIPMLLLFNDADEMFPPTCTILFKDSIEYFLDMESVAILGLILTDYLLSQLRSLQFEE